MMTNFSSQTGKGKKMLKSEQMHLRPSVHACPTKLSTYIFFALSLGKTDKKRLRQMDEAHGKVSGAQPLIGKWRNHIAGVVPWETPLKQYKPNVP